MKVTVKILQGVECCVEVTENNTTEDLKSAVEKELNIPPGSQRLILKGKTLQDKTILKEYKIKDGDKVHLAVRNSAVFEKKTCSRSELENALRKIIKEHFRNEEDCNRVVAATIKIFEQKLVNLSLDDIEHICEEWNKRSLLHF